MGGVRRAVRRGGRAAALFLWRCLAALGASSNPPWKERSGKRWRPWNTRLRRSLGAPGVGAVISILIASALALCLACAAFGQGAANLAPNPGAEALVGQRPAGFGLYAGAGKAVLLASQDQPHSGKRAARLEINDWYHWPDNRRPPTVNVFLLIGESNGYAPGNAPRAVRGASAYAADMWVRTNLPWLQLRVFCWSGSDSSSRRVIRATPGIVRGVGAKWTHIGARFTLPADAQRFAVAVGITGDKGRAQLGWLEVDDVTIRPLSFPGGELRAIWWGEVRAEGPQEGRREIDDSIRQLKQIGFNTLFVWLSSLYIASWQRPELVRDNKRLSWPWFDYLLDKAADAGMQVHVWYSPWIYKNTSRAVELRDHPEWAAVSAGGKPSSAGVCAARPEVRSFELELLRLLLSRYGRRIAGIHLEEPGYPWGDYCYCNWCREKFRELFGLELTPGSHAEARANWKAFWCTDFVARLRQMMVSTVPALWLSANGSPGANPDWSIGRDWTTWARRHYIDFYVPQVYTTSLGAFNSRLSQTRAQIGQWCPVVPGIALTWSGIYPKHNSPETVAAEIQAARKAGCPGFVIFHRYHLTDAEAQAISRAIASH